MKEHTRRCLVLTLIALLLSAALSQAQAPPAPVWPSCPAPPAPENDSWPRANSDALGSTSTTPITFTSAMLTANDFAVGGAPMLTVTTPIRNSISSAGGTITGSDPFTYTPPLTTFSGTDAFAYEIADAAGHKATGLAFVTITAPAFVNAPNVTGIPVGAATSALSAAGLTASIVNANSTTVAIGVVASQSPGVGSSVAVGSAVNLVVSAGAVVPNVVLMTQAAASSALTTAGLRAGTITQANDASVPAGAVIQQAPAAFTNANPGSNVALTVSLGPAVVMNVVPNVVSQTRTLATSAITGVGLTAGTMTFANSGTIAAGSIVSTTPAAGTALAAGSPVAMVVSLGSDGLVVAWGFDESAGLVANDSSAVAKNGTVRGALRVPGKFGGALSFDGIDDWVTLADTTSSPIDLTNGMTIEAWVNPSQLSDWDTIILKERGAGLLSYALYANDGSPQASGFNVAAGYQRMTNGATDVAVRGPSALPLNTWTHLALTYDGTTERLFINGVQASSRPQTGNMAVANGALRVGGNTAFSNEFYRGLIDEVRVYNRARTAAQIVVDMNTPIVR